MNGGERIAAQLKAHGVKQIFTLCGGHISPILVGAEKLGIRVIDTRSEANAVFAADAAARVSGIIGVAAVTAGPGVTNTITALKNAQMAQTPLLLLGGAAATVLKGRGSLQDIEQLAVLRSITKYAVKAKRVKDLDGLLPHAIQQAYEGTPGPVFVECPIDLLYDESLVRQWYLPKDKPQAGWTEKAIQWYLRRHLNKIFEPSDAVSVHLPVDPKKPKAGKSAQAQLAKRIQQSERPVMVLGSGAMTVPALAPQLAAAVDRLGIPVYLSGMARGLLGADHPLQQRHHRKEALRNADLVLLLGVPCDFRLD